MSASPGLAQSRMPFTRSAQARTLVRIALLFLTSSLALASLIFPLAMRPTSFPLRVGDVTTQDIQAPYTLTYESQVLTERARQEAANQVATIYLPADPAITRRQIERLRVTQNYISTVRMDTFASSSQQIIDLAAMSDIQLSPEISQRILNLNDPRWEAVQQETTSVLEQIMRSTVREDHIAEARRNMPTLISYDLPEDQAALVSELVIPFIIANSLFSADQTQVARQVAAQAVEPIQRTYISSETIVSRGQLINSETLEALVVFGLVQPSNQKLEIFAAAALVISFAGLVVVYFNRRRIPPLDDLRSLTLLCAVFLIFLFGARFIIPNRTVLPYLFPIPAFGLTLAALFNMEIGMIFSLVISILTAYNLPNSLDLSLYYILASLTGVLVLGRARRIGSFIYAAAAIGCVGTGVILAYRLTNSLSDWLGIATLVGAAFLNGIASASLTLLFQFIFAQLLGLTTAIQMMELSRPDHPLLQYILRNAPGTYQHSLQVANLAEQAAERIGADALLVRVGAIYHDCGKATNPQFFIENQIPGQTNTHEDLDPTTTAAIIIQHVSDGLNLARKHRLPPRIRDFITEHHGTFLTRYQYVRALEAAGNKPELVDPEAFRYPGPRPRSRETALLMLADGVEAKARSDLPKDETELRALIKKMFEICQKEGQLDDTRLTLRDLNQVVDSFISTLQGTYHPRVRYPEVKGPLSVPEPLAGRIPANKKII
jgi:cyclic-di-AMP phosphodiesterase PgpH